jgi:serine protease Do
MTTPDGAPIMSRFPRLSRVLGGFLLILAVSAIAPAAVLAQREAESLSTSFRKAADRAAPFVVAIRPLTAVGPMFPAPSPGGPVEPREMIPGLAPRPLEPGRQAGGSGIVVDAARGLILTCEQVIDNALRVVIILADGREIETKRMLRDPQTGLVLLIVDTKGVHLQEAQWGDSQALHTGDWVLSIGRPSARSKAVSAGIVSETGSDPDNRPEDTIRTDAVITAVNTGGPLINLDGKVVGINQARTGPWGRADGFGYAIPSALARRVASELAEFGRVRRGYLGLVLGPEGPETRDPRTRSTALMVNGITPGSPAAEAGFRLGDRIVALDGRPITGLEALSRAVEDAPVGQEFTVTVERGGERREIKVQTRQRPEPPGVSRRPLGPNPPGMGRRIRPRDGSRGSWIRPTPSRQPEPTPRQPDQAPGQEESKPERAPEATPEPGPTLPPALDLDPAGQPSSKPGAGNG